MYDGVLSRAWDRLTDGLAAAYARFDALIADLAGPGLAPWIAAAVIALAFVIIVAMLRPPPQRRMSRGHPSRRAAPRAAPPKDAAAFVTAVGTGAEEAEAEVEEQDGEWRRPFDHLVSRRGWKRLPHDFLWELVARLQDVEGVEDFADFAERRRLAPRRLRRIAKRHAPEAAVAEVAAAVLRIGAKHKKDQDAALALALRLEAKNPEVLLGVAADYYRARRYAAAVPLFEQGMALGQDRLETLRAWPHPDPSVDRRIAALGPLLQDAARMYMTCLEKAPPAG